MGFVELLESTPGHQITEALSPEQRVKLEGASRVNRLLEKSWPIEDHLKNEKAEDLFAWIGKRIAEVVGDGCRAWPGEVAQEIPLGVTFSFPIVLVYYPYSSSCSY